MQNIYSVVSKLRSNYNNTKVIQCLSWYAACMFRLLYRSHAVPCVPNSNHIEDDVHAHGTSCHSTGHASQFVLMAKVAIYVMGTLLLCVCHTRPDRWKDRSRERGRGLMNAGTVGEKVRDGKRYFFPCLFSLCAGRWPLARRYEENVTQHYPSLCPRRRWSFFFCAMLWRENYSFPLWLMYGTWAGSTQEGSKERIAIPLYCTFLLSDLPHVLIWPTTGSEDDQSFQGFLPQDVTFEPLSLVSWPPSRRDC